MLLTLLKATTGGGGVALAVDASTPTLAAGSNDPWVTASFTPPVNSLIVLVAMGDWFSGTPTLTPTSSGLTFASQIKAGALNRGVVQIWTSEVGAAGGSARTISCTTSLGSDVGGIKAFVLTGYDTGTIVDTTNSGQGSTDPLNPTALTTGVDGCWVLGGVVDWNASGAPSSTDVGDSFSDADLSIMAIRKATATATSGTAVTFNLDAPGSGGPLWQWAAISIRPAAGGQVAAESGTSAVASSSYATQVKVAPQGAVCSAASATTASRSNSKAQAGAAAAVATSTARAVKVAKQSAVCSSAATTQATGRKVIAKVGVTTAASTVAATAAKKTAAAGISSAAATIQARAAKKAPAAGVSSAAASPAATCRKVAAGAGQSYAAGLTYRSIVIAPRAVSATCFGAGSMSGRATKVAKEAATTTGAGFTRSSVVKRATTGGVVSAAASCQASPRKRALAKASSVACAAASGVGRKRATSRGTAYAAGYCEGKRRALSSTTPRPDTGTTARPVGVPQLTLQPDLGTTLRPVGAPLTTARPNTGMTPRPAIYT